MGESNANAPELLLQSQLEKVSACLPVIVIDEREEKKVLSWSKGRVCSLDNCLRA